MCNPACIEFGRDVLTEAEVRGRSVLEVGSMNVNGSLREVAEPFGPDRYVGVDLDEGPGVDEVCDAAGLLDRFGPESFDVVLCTEVLEHVREWPSVIHNLKMLVKAGGVLLITTRSRGFPYHEYPFDYWRYELSDMEEIFSDFSIEALESDSFMPGVFVKARKPEGFTERSLVGYRLWSIVSLRRSATIRALDIAIFRVRRPVQKLVSALLPASLRDALRDRLKI